MGFKGPVRSAQGLCWVIPPSILVWFEYRGQGEGDVLSLWCWVGDQRCAHAQKSVHGARVIFVPGWEFEHSR